ncbi:MAG: hypothetical protein PUG96_02495 [Prevotellaceae bacterium]|nr:hypothetical protein [Prevotella sp.]MDD7272822.1 hypothetical protein [Prevotellaceae bacterium]
MYTKKDRAKVFKLATEKLKKDDNILFIEDLISELPISKPTFYKYYPKGSDDYAAILELINKNRISVKRDIRKKLRKSGKAAELLSLYRMICTEEERRVLNQSYIDVKGKVDNKIEIGFIETEHKPAKSEDDVDV